MLKAKIGVLKGVGEATLHHDVITVEEILATTETNNVAELRKKSETKFKSIKEAATAMVAAKYIY